MQGPRGDEPLRGLDGYEQMVNTFAENAKTYWRLWGPLGEPMVRVVDTWAEQQRSYLRWLRENYGEGTSLASRGSAPREEGGGGDSVG